MVIKIGSVTVTAGGTAQNLVLGFIPDYFRMTNQTTVTGTFMGEWFKTMANGTSLKWRVGGTPVFTSDAADGFTPFQTTDQLMYVPAQAPYNVTTRVPMGASTALVITGISKAANASVTATHSFTTADIGVTVVTFSGNSGMTEINTLRGVITGVTATTSFTVNIDSTNFSTWAAGGNPQCNVITGAPVSTLYSNQILNTAQANLGQIGLTLGTDYMENTSDVWNYVAMSNFPGV